MVRRTAVIRVFDASGTDAMGLAVEPTQLVDAAEFDAPARRGFRFVGETIVKVTDEISKEIHGGPDRTRLAELVGGLQAP